MSTEQQPRLSTTFRDAYRFEVGSGSDISFTGIVYKKAPRYSWEAKVDGTSIVAVRESRYAAVHAAVAEAMRQKEAGATS